MEIPSALTTMPGRDYCQPELELLCSTAAVVRNEHVNDAALCAVCGSTWPCQRAQLAEHNLAVL